MDFMARIIEERIHVSRDNDIKNPVTNTIGYKNILRIINKMCGSNAQKTFNRNWREIMAKIGMKSCINPQV